MQSLDSLLSQEVAAMTWGPYALSATGTDTNKRVLGRIINDATKVSNAHFMTDTVRNLLFHGHKSEFLDAAKPLLQFVISNALPFPANIVFQDDGNCTFALYPVIMDYIYAYITSSISVVSRFVEGMRFYSLLCTDRRRKK